MALIRHYEERLIKLRTDGEVVGPVHPYIGQEAIAVGVCAALQDRDLVASHYRGHGHAVARGVSLDTLTAELFGRADGLCGGKAAALISDPSRNLLISSGIVGGGVPIAAGAALSCQLAGEGAVAVAFFGDGALGSGVVHETLNIAQAQRLPLILVCENNGYQAGTRTEEVFPEVSVARIPQAHRLRTLTVDGNDVSAVHAATSEAVDAARAGSGPAFIEARTYLTRFHLQFDRPSPERRPADELEHWLARDPLALLGATLRAESVPDEQLAAAHDAAVAAVDHAVAFARSSAWPAESEAFTQVWAGAR